MGTDAPLPRQELLPSLTTLHAFRADDFNSTVLFKNEEPKTVEVRGTLDVTGTLEVEDDAVVNVDGDVNVDGSVNLGPLAGLSAVGASGDLRIIYGIVDIVNQEPVIRVGEGFRVIRNTSSAGRYDIVYDEAFPTTPAVMLTPEHVGDRPYTISAGVWEPNRCVIYIWRGNGRPATSLDRAWIGGFSFIAIGPR
mgnify:CR=1 FL=1